MTTTPTGRPPVADLATWQAARDELLVREKAHTREGDALAAGRGVTSRADARSAPSPSMTSGAVRQACIRALRHR